MKIAFLSVRPPYPPNTGGRIRTFHLLREISRDHDVTLITATQHESEEAGLASLRDAVPRVVVRVVRIGAEGTVGRIVRAVRNPVDSLPFTWAKYRHPRFTRLVREAAGTDGYDVVHCDHVQIAHTLGGLATPPRLLDAHNVESMLVRRMGEHARRGWRRLAIAWQAAKTFEAERRSFLLFDRCLAVSDDDARAIRAMAPGVPVSVVPNGVDVAYFTPRSGPGAAGDMVFAGAMDWSPNVDAVTFFVRDILPMIRRRVPGATFWVVGRDPSDLLVRHLAGESVRFTGSVDDVRPHVERARVVVVPLRIGGGTRLKILEAWALGKPVVSTALGAEGLPVRDGENIALADTPEAFAERTVQLLADARLGARLGAAGREMAEQRFAWEHVARELVGAYEATLAGAGRSRRRGEPAPRVSAADSVAAREPGGQGTPQSA